jgi:HlyD family secretion protein
MKIIRAVGKFILPVLAIIGVAAAIKISIFSTPVPAIATPVQESTNKRLNIPFDSYVTGAGLVEANGRTVNIVPVTSGVVSKVFVRVGQDVMKDDPLFVLDSREIAADLVSRDAALKSAEARIIEAQAQLADSKRQYALVESVKDKRAVSADEKAKRLGQVEIAKAKLETARAEVESSKASLAVTQTNLELRNIYAPMDGTILQMNAMPGQFATSNDNPAPIVMGQTQKLAVRIDFDENDAWRVQAGQPAWGVIRGNKELTTKLEFDHIEPYVRPKQSLTGATNERTDTRVLQVVFSFSSAAFPAYVGQQIDAYMKTDPIAPPPLPLAKN